MKTVKNALDVLILQDLEATMKTDKSSDYYIVSKDNDFDGFIDEKLKKKYKIKRIFEVCQASTSKDTNARQKKTDIEAASKKKEQVIRSHIGRYLKEYNKWKEDIVEAYMESSSRQELNNRLQQTFENEAVSEILSALKNIIKDMPGR